MRHPSLVARALVALALVCACAASAAAQSEVVSLASHQLRLTSAGASAPAGYAMRISTLAAALVLESRAPDVASRARQDRARRILAAGAGFALSAAVTPLYVLPNRDPCWGSERAKGGVPLKAAATIGALGVAMIVGGATWLGVESRRHGHYASRRQRLIAMAVGALTLGLGQALQGSLFFLDQICHS
jgi:hypothetical protein